MHVSLFGCRPAKVARSERARTLHTSRGLYSSRHLPVRPEAGLSAPRRAYPFRGGPIRSIRPEAGLSVARLELVTIPVGALVPPIPPPP
ncbi:hypothetical protein T484DRAFT_1962434, partial [Baffinella frigidus]